MTVLPETQYLYEEIACICKGVFQGGNQDRAAHAHTIGIDVESGIGTYVDRSGNS